MAADSLDNPVWHALVGAHAGFAVGVGGARHYPRGIAPFSAIVEPTLSAYADLARDLPAGMAARLFRPRNEPTPQDWDTISAHPIIQMVFDRSGSQTPHDMPARVLSLGRDDVPDMLTLADITRPGPFALRTIELGGYVGVRQAATRRLVAMGGERFRLSSHVELSAIAVHPDARGRGLGAAVTAHLTNSALARGLVPFSRCFRATRRSSCTSGWGSANAPGFGFYGAGQSPMEPSDGGPADRRITRAPSRLLWLAANPSQSHLAVKLCEAQSTGPDPLSY